MAPYTRLMKPAEDAFGLRAAAKAADRGTTARAEWPAFQGRLTELGYTPRAIAHAFSALSGAGAVTDALEVLEAMSRPQSPAVALSFDLIETRSGPARANRPTISSVERDGLGIHVTYGLAEPLGVGSDGPRGEATDDLGNEYNNLGGHVGLARDGWRGRLTMPLPPSGATTLRIRITWDASGSSTREIPAYEIRVSLPD
jgi:hypothetical protein